MLRCARRNASQDLTIGAVSCVMPLTQRACTQFYVAGASVAAAAGAAPWTRAARLPLVVLFGGALAAERCLPPRLHRVLAAGDEGQVPRRSHAQASRWRSI